MRKPTISFAWNCAVLPGSFSTGVSLHSHTLHSKELLDFIPRIAASIPGLPLAIRRYEDRFRRYHNTDLDYNRAWWTPPLSAKQAFQLEAGQIEDRCGLQALVSITDHDNIDAASHLNPAKDERHPVSVEWTVPTGETFVHIGIHNLPRGSSDRMMAAMHEVTAKPSMPRIAELLSWFHSHDEMLTILNHPLWDEKKIGNAAHLSAVQNLLGKVGHHIHALELNGLRTWTENQDVIDLAEQWRLPVISGGDRHSKEPNANINLSMASNFAEFVDEIRHDQFSHILFLDHYRESFRQRMIHNICDILSDYPEHSYGWTRWTDRVFYRRDDGLVRSLSECWQGSGPGIVRSFVSLMRLAESRRMRYALKLALSDRGELAL